MSAFASCGHSDTFALGRYGRVEDGRGSLGQATGRERVATVEATVQLKRHTKLSCKATLPAKQAAGACLGETICSAAEFARLAEGNIAGAGTVVCRPGGTDRASSRLKPFGPHDRPAGARYGKTGNVAAGGTFA